MEAKGAVIDRDKEPHMAGYPLGASSPNPTPQRTLHLVPSTRTRRNHGAFMLGGHLACVYSTRQASRCYGVSFEIGAGTLVVNGSMTPAQARQLALALAGAADAVDQQQPGHALRRPVPAPAVPVVLAELRAAHRLLALALAHMSASGQARFAAESERLGLGLDGATRHHERAAVIALAERQQQPDDAAPTDAAVSMRAYQRSMARFELAEAQRLADQLIDALRGEVSHG
ncbi:MAG: hypothetical protein QM750_11705 [Rubrivivax sp.]